MAASDYLSAAVLIVCGRFEPWQGERIVGRITHTNGTLMKLCDGARFGVRNLKRGRIEIVEPPMIKAL